MSQLIFLNIYNTGVLFYTDAAARGVSPDQIIFTDVAMKHEHIRRSELADLFLDTYALNHLFHLFCMI
jgi:predicted O-linked N-acetylglucosamine transferase (SPINDLY family)